jgi:hypothetical protein
MMQNKIAAFLYRSEIRDCFDIEFLLRRGIALPASIGDVAVEFRNKILGFKEIDFRVKLGSIVESDTREYYATNRFSYLEQKLTSLLSNSH